MNNIKVWVQGEVVAERFLKDKGYKIIDKNCKICGSEIDIVSILSKKQQKNELIKNFRCKEFNTKQEKKFYKTVLNGQIKMLEDIIVFIEVKSRSSKKFGEPYEAVTNEKQHNIIRGAKAYLSQNNMINKKVRFDVISVIDDEIEHIKSAFEG